MSVPSNGNNDLLQEVAKLSVCQVLDALGASWPVETSIRPTDPSFRLCGPALTALCAPDDNLSLHHALYLAQPGQVLVVSCPGGTDVALWGELMSVSAKARGLAGTILDAPARDPLEISALGYPVFARSIHPRRAAKQRYGAVGVTVQCGVLKVASGDIIMADVNGIVALSAADLPRAVEGGRAIVSREEELRGKLERGNTMFEIQGLQALLPEGDRGRRA